MMQSFRIMMHNYLLSLQMIISLQKSNYKRLIPQNRNLQYYQMRCEYLPLSSSCCHSTRFKHTNLIYSQYLFNNSIPQAINPDCFNSCTLKCVSQYIAPNEYESTKEPLQETNAQKKFTVPPTRLARPPEVPTPSTRTFPDIII